MKKIIIILVIVVSSYAVIGSGIVDNGVNVIKNHHNQLEEVMNSMD